MKFIAQFCLLLTIARLSEGRSPFGSFMDMIGIGGNPVEEMSKNDPFTTLADQFKNSVDQAQKGGSEMIQKFCSDAYNAMKGYYDKATGMCG